MFIFYGTSNKKIKTYTDEKTVCDSCGGYRKEYRIYQPCFHVFWIPFFPIGRKYMISKCSGCNAQYETITDPYISETRTPFFMFLGPLLILAFITFGYFSDKAEQKRHTEYINSPVVGDVYIMKVRTTNEGNTYYCFTKIINIQPDSIDLHLGAYDYSYKVSKMDTADYFLTDGYYTFGKSEIKEMWDDKSLNFIKRGTNSD